MHISASIERIAAMFPEDKAPMGNEVLYKGADVADPDLAEIMSFFSGRSWRSITPSEVFNFRHALSYFSPCALAYFTPAWMTCALLDRHAVDTAIENLVGTLGEVNPAIWTQEQRLIICAWLAHFNTYNLNSVKALFERAGRNIAFNTRNIRSDINKGT